MDWITPIISGASTFVTGLVSNIGPTFTGLFVQMVEVEAGVFEAQPTDIALFLLSMIGLTVGYFVLNWTYGIVARMIKSRRKKKARA